MNPLLFVVSSGNIGSVYTEILCIDFFGELYVSRPDLCYSLSNVPNCNRRINQERYILPDDGYMLSETCRRNDDGPLVF
jgi:hypothetical protein